MERTTQISPTPRRRIAAAKIRETPKIPVTRRRTTRLNQTAPLKKALRRKAPARKTARRRKGRKTVLRRNLPRGNRINANSAQENAYRASLDGQPGSAVLTILKSNSVTSNLTLLLQFPHEVIVDHVKQVGARIRSGDAVRFIGIDDQLELFAGLN